MAGAIRWSAGNRQAGMRRNHAGGLGERASTRVAEVAQLAQKLRFSCGMADVCGAAMHQSLVRRIGPFFGTGEIGKAGGDHSSMLRMVRTVTGQEGLRLQSDRHSVNCPAHTNHMTCVSIGQENWYQDAERRLQVPNTSLPQGLRLQCPAG